MTRIAPKPQTTSKPLPTPLAMSAAPTKPSPSPLPIRNLPPNPPPDAEDREEFERCIHNIREIEEPWAQRVEVLRHLEPIFAARNSRPHPKPSFPIPKLRLKVLDLTHPGTEVFFDNNNPATALSEAVEVVLSTLYEATKPDQQITPTRSVTLILRSMGGVAYTTGSDDDDNDKKIHFSLDYIHDVSKRSLQPGLVGAEIQGVIVHEMVHCWQWNGLGAAPGGLIEGIADYVRLKAGLSPPHWKREAGEKWDAGYQKTGYFLEWIENKFGQGSIRKVNQALREEEYIEERFWKSLFDKQVTDLWDEYLKSLDSREDNQKGKTHSSRLDSLPDKGNCVKDPDTEETDKTT